MLPPKIIGHSSQRASLERLFLKNKLPHALLFAGNAGIGKKLAGLELSRTLFCETVKHSQNLQAEKLYGGCGTCKNCVLFAKHNIPDFHFVDCFERESANSENIRALLYKLNLTSFFSGKRIVFFDNAEYLSTSSANILLKSLEEPRNDTHFILICANPYRLPVTLLSRCQILHFNTLTIEETESIIEHSVALQTAIAPLLKNSLDISEIAYFAHGSLENISAFAANYEKWLTIKELFEHITNGELAKSVELAELVSKDKDHLRLNIRLLQGLARNAMHTIAAAEKLQRLAVCLTNLISSERLIFERNIAANYILLRIFSDLASADSQTSFTELDDSVTLFATL